MNKPSRIIDEMYETAAGLHKAGVIDKRGLLEYGALVLATRVPQYTGENVRALRSRLKVSQSVLAMMINTSVATVRAWEAGTKKPGGPSRKLLHLLELKGIEALL